MKYKQNFIDPKLFGNKTKTQRLGKRIQHQQDKTNMQNDSVNQDTCILLCTSQSLTSKTQRSLLVLIYLKKTQQTTYELTFRPKLCKQITTELRFCLSHKSTVWKVSWAGTPNCLAASRNALMFSIHLKAIVVWLIFFTEPGWIELANLKSGEKN